MSANTVHLVRHGEVANPHHVVYADLPGYRLSARGEDQAAATAALLGDRPVGRVVSSPLLRARQTATAIAERHGIAVTLEPDLTEWAGGKRWAGVRWEDLDSVFPGELTQYLQHPLEVTFAGETIPECGARVARAVESWTETSQEGEIVFVGHQDPIHAGFLALTGKLGHPDMDGAEFEYHQDKPAHAAVITLERAGDGWRRIGYWEPEQGEVFPPLE